MLNVNLLFKIILALAIPCLWGVKIGLASEVSPEIREHQQLDIDTNVDLKCDRTETPLTVPNCFAIIAPLPSDISTNASDLLDITNIISQNSIPTETTTDANESDQSEPNSTNTPTEPNTIEQSGENSTETPIDQNTIEQSGENSTETGTNQEDLAKKSQNPISNMISVPFQNNTNFGVGQFDRTANILNIQPVIPTSISQNWLLINRVIMPVAYQPELARIPLPNGETESIGDVFGLGDIIYQGFFSPKDSGNFTWGVGPILSFPSATNDVLGSGHWGAGPAFVGLVTSKRIVAGMLINQLWSYAGDSDRSDVSLLTVQPFFNYNFNKGWYVSISPIITADWQSEPGNQWTVPIGGGFGRVFPIGKQPVNVSLSAFWNATKPEGAADWTVRTQFVLLFPN